MKADRAQLERFVVDLLKSQPPRRAPSSLAVRVLAEIERRGALPWWRKPFAQWPLAARLVFLAASPIFVKLALMASLWVTGGIATAPLSVVLAPELAWLRMLGGLMSALGEAYALTMHHLPSYLVYGVLGVAGLYAALFGLGAAAYRTLYSHR